MRPRSETPQGYVISLEDVNETFLSQFQTRSVQTAEFFQCVHSERHMQSQ